jgi:hypothetical protein
MKSQYTTEQGRAHMKVIYFLQILIIDVINFLWIIWSFILFKILKIYIIF